MKTQTIHNRENIPEYRTTGGITIQFQIVLQNYCNKKQNDIGTETDMLINGMELKFQI